MKRGLVIAGVVVALLVGTVAVAQARGGAFGGQGMMGGGGRGGMMMGGGGRGGMMMGGGGRGGMMMGGGAGAGQMPCANGGANYDPATAAAHVDQMLAQHKAMLTQLEAQLAAATDEAVKARLTTQIERQQLTLGAQEAHAAVLKTQPATWEVAALATAKAEVEYWSKATAVDPVNKAWVTLRSEQAKQHLTYVESLQPKTN
ncbi:MAG TPA: hypothetical protein VNT75_13055 [Symbiobacteriaceae bacterium]|nr:hypothetical protein [Symbiobacteriaceae bacterium]